jgi:hypothetical protein
MKIIKISGKNNNILRFDTDARVEIFIDQYDIEDHDKYKLIIAQNISDEEKIKQLKEVASEIVLKKLLNLNDAISENKLDIAITTGNTSVAVIDFERMPWNDMLHPEIEE